MSEVGVVQVDQNVYSFGSIVDKDVPHSHHQGSQQHEADQELEVFRSFCGGLEEELRLSDEHNSCEGDDGE